MRAATPLFMENMLLGSLLGAGSVFAYASESDAACQAFPFVLGVAYVLLLGSLYIKTWRLMIIFRQSQMRLIRISLWYMSRILLALLTVEVAFNIAWQVSSPPMLEMVAGTPFPRSYHECGASSFNAWQGVSYGYKAVFLLYGIFLSFMTRGLPDAYNESAWIGVSIYNVGLSGAVVLLVVYAGKTQDTLSAVFVLVSVAIVWVAVGTAVLITAPKLYRIYFAKSKDDDITNKSSLQPSQNKGDANTDPVGTPSQTEPVGLMMLDRFERSQQQPSQSVPVTMHTNTNGNSHPANPMSTNSDTIDHDSTPIVKSN